MTNAKARSVEFVGVPRDADGDFHFEVDRDEFVKVTGREPTAEDRIGPKKFRLYFPATAAALRSDRRVKVKLSVSPV